MMEFNTEESNEIRQELHGEIKWVNATLRQIEQQYVDNLKMVLVHVKKLRNNMEGADGAIRATAAPAPPPPKVQTASSSSEDDCDVTKVRRAQKRPRFSYRRRPSNREEAIRATAAPAPPPPKAKEVGAVADADAAPCTSKYKFFKYNRPRRD